jgi:hypothetical protein
MPKIVFILLLIYDVFYLKKFTYMYYYGWVLLIPLIFDYILFTLKEFSIYNLDNYLKNILVVIDDDSILIESVETIVESCKKYAVDLYFNNMTPEFAPALYSQISDKYLKHNNIFDENEINRVSYLRRKEFTTLRVVYTQTLIFGFMRDRYTALLNAFYFFCLAFAWLYIILHGIL